MPHLQPILSYSIQGLRTFSMFIDFDPVLLLWWQLIMALAQATSSCLWNVFRPHLMKQEHEKD